MASVEVDVDVNAKSIHDVDLSLTEIVHEQTSKKVTKWRTNARNTAMMMGGLEYFLLMLAFMFAVTFIRDKAVVTAHHSSLFIMRSQQKACASYTAASYDHTHKSAELLSQLISSSSATKNTTNYTHFVTGQTNHWGSIPAAAMSIVKSWNDVQSVYVINPQGGMVVAHNSTDPSRLNTTAKQLLLTVYDPDTFVCWVTHWNETTVFFSRIAPESLRHGCF